MTSIDVTHFTDPGCPWAYSASPALAVLRWRYGDQLDWRLVTDRARPRSAEQYERARLHAGAPGARGYLASAAFGHAVRDRSRASAWPAPARLPRGRRHAAARARAASSPCSGRCSSRGSRPTLRDGRGRGIVRALLARVAGLDAAGDRRHARRRPRSRRPTRPTAPRPAPPRAARPSSRARRRNTDGPVRYTAPSLIFATGRPRLEAGGFQPIEAYDVCIANLDPTLDRATRRSRATTPSSCSTPSPDGLTTARGRRGDGRGATTRRTTRAAEEALIDLLAGDGRAPRRPRQRRAVAGRRAPPAMAHRPRRGDRRGALGERARPLAGRADSVSWISICARSESGDGAVLYGLVARP